MKKRNGFTLVELMGILVILGVLLIFTVPTITKMLKGSEQNEKAEYEDTVCTAAKTYITLNKDVSPYNTFSNNANGIVTIEIKSKLIDEGYLADNIKDPSTKSVPSGDVTVKKTSGKIECIF